MQHGCSTDRQPRSHLVLSGSRSAICVADTSQRRVITSIPATNSDNVGNWFLILLGSCIPETVNQTLESAVLELQSLLEKQPKKHGRQKVRQDEASLQPSCIRICKE